MIMGQEELKDDAFSHFQELYEDTSKIDPKAQLDLLHGIPSIIYDAEKRELAKPIMEHGIRSAIWSLFLGLDT